VRQAKRLQRLQADRAGGRTTPQGARLSEVVPGPRRGRGGAFGAGVGHDLTALSGVVLERSRGSFKFQGTGHENVDTATIGFVHRF
jgi:hypothetical protein